MPLPLILDLRPSKWLRILSCFLLFLAAAGLFFLPVAWFWRLFLLLGLVLFFYKNPLPEPPALLRLEANGQVALPDKTEGDWMFYHLLPGAFVHPWLLAFFLVDEEGKRLPVVLSVDSAESQNLRRLRLFLRCHFPS